METNTPIILDPDKPLGIEIIRSVVFQRLRSKDRWEQINPHDESFNKFFQNSDGNRRLPDYIFLLIQEIFWEMIAQGVIVPGINLSNPNLPFFRLTDYGKRVIAEERYLPHDPTGYINRFRTEIPDTGPVAIGYLEECLRCFTTNCFVASLMMLGIASEIIFLEFCEILEASLIDKADRERFSKLLAGVSMVAKFNFVRDKIDLALKKDKKKLPETTVITFLSLFDLVRIQRNDIGHPQETFPSLTHDGVFVYLKMFPEYCKTLNEVKLYLHRKVPSTKGTG